MSDNKKDNVIPFIKEKETRAIIKFQFSEASKKKVKDTLDSINEKMEDLKESVRKQREYLSGTAHVEMLAPEERRAEEMTSTLDESELEKEYRRKQNEMRKKREENNRSVTRSYNLRHPSRDDRKK